MTGGRRAPMADVLRLLQMQRSLLEDAASGADAAVVLGRLLELIETCLPDAIGSVLMVDPETGTLSTLAAPRLPAEFSAAVDGLAVGDGVGSCGTAAARGETVVVEDIATDPLWAEFRDLALPLGLRACWSAPIFDDAGDVAGTFALYYATARRPTEEELELVHVAAGIASIVLERRRALELSAHEAAEREALELRYRTLVEQLPLVVYVDALDETSSNLFTSPRIEEVLGFSVEEWRRDERLFVKLLHPDDRERVLAAHRHTHATHEPLSIDYRLRARDGRYVWLRDEGVVVTDDAGAPLHLQGYLLDVSAERDAEERLRRQALYDPLTGLANRACFTERLEHAIGLQQRAATQAGLLYVDVDDFKGINDRYGHHSGDLVLCALAGRLSSVIRPGDTAARLGGDEFAVVLNGLADAAAAAAVADRLQRVISRPVELEGRRIEVRVSIGIAIGTDAEALLKEADAAMYRAKADASLRYAFFDASLDEAILTRTRRLDELAEAVERGELELHYQPIVALPSGEVEGYEALLRWQHPTDGLLPPLDFVPLAEQSGLIVPIGRWVLEQACTHAVAAGGAPGRSHEIAVNVSARQLQHPSFIRDVDETLAATGLPPQRLVLEITESVLIDTTDVEERLLRLRERGVKIALDDFGTGYASLSNLQRLPVDIVKIDRSFTESVDGDPEAEPLLAAIISLGNALGVRIVAEGIERVTQSEIVSALGVESGQGFHFGRPAPADADAAESPHVRATG